MPGWANFDVTVAVSLIGAVVGGLVTFFVGLATRSKLNSESANEISQAVAHLIPPLRQNIEALRAELTQYKKRVHTAESKALRLDSKVAALEDKAVDCQKQVDVLETKMVRVKAENRDLLQGIRVLMDQFRELGVTPRWKPDLNGWDE